MKLTNHSKVRYKERVGVTHKEQVKLFKEALTKGKSPADIKDPSLRRFLTKPGAKAKLYKNYVFVYSKTSKVLYTVYELPERFKEAK